MKKTAVPFSFLTKTMQKQDIKSYCKKYIGGLNSVPRFWYSLFLYILSRVPRSKTNIFYPSSCGNPSGFSAGSSVFAPYGLVSNGQSP